MEDHNNSINIFLKNDETKNQILNGSSSHSRYIILMNETLQMENRNLSAQVKELEYKVSEAEEEIDRYDVSKRYTKGLLKNLVELEKFRAIVANNNQTIINAMNLDINQYSSKAKRHIRILESLMFVLVAIFWETKYFDNFQLFVVFFIMLFNISFVENMHFNLPKKQFLVENEENSRSNESIKKITDSQDFLSDYIDNI